MSILSYWFSDLCKLDNIRVSYSLVTESGNEILEIQEKITPKEIIIAERGTYGLYFRENVSKKKDFEFYKHYMECKCHNLLNEYRKKQKKEFNNGVLMSGNYITKVSYNYYCDYEELTYQEYKKWVDKK